MKDFIETLPLYVDFNIDGKDYIITHSWLVDKFERNLVTDDYKEHINEIDVKNSIWDRDWSLTSNDSNVTVIHGHTPTVRRRWSGVRVELAQVRILQNNINIDCGMYNNLCRGGNLAAYCIETGESIYAFNKEDLDMLKLDYTGLREDDFSFKRLSLDESVLNSTTSMTVFNNRVYSLLP